FGLQGRTDAQGTGPFAGQFSVQEPVPFDIDVFLPGGGHVDKGRVELHQGVYIGIEFLNAPPLYRGHDLKTEQGGSPAPFNMLGNLHGQSSAMVGASHLWACSKVISFLLAKSATWSCFIFPTPKYLACGCAK